MAVHSLNKRVGNSSMPRELKRLVFGLYCALCITLVSVAVRLNISPVYEDVCIDIYTGRIKYSTIFFWLTVKNQIVETTISRLCGPSEVEDWRLVMLRGGLSTRHPPFHSAIYQMERFTNMWADVGLSAQDQIIASKLLLSTWQRPGGNQKALDFLDNFNFLDAITNVLQRATRP